MTILLVDFPSGQPGRYGGDNTLLNQVLYSHGGLFLDPHPGADGQGYTWGLGSSTNRYMEISLPDVFQRFVFSFRLWMDRLPPELGLATVFQLWEDQDDSGYDVQIYPDGSFGNSEPCLVTGAWQHVECMMGAGDDYQGFELRVDGETVIYSATGGAIHRPEPPNPPIYFWRINNSGAPSFCLLKDFVLQYGHSAVFLGQGNVRQLLPAADVTTGWTLVGAASEHAALDNSPPVGGEYIASGVLLPAPSVTSLAGLHANTTAIHGLFPSLYMDEDTAGAVGVQTSLIAGGTPRDGEVKNPGVVPNYYLDSFEVDPATGDPWDPATVAALTLSINRTV